MRSWNARDWDTFDAYHDQSDVVVYWPGRECTPTRGGPDHCAESERFCAAFPDNKVKHPYDILFGDGEYTTFVGPFTGTFTGPLELPDGTVIEPTGKSFEVVFSTIAGGTASSSRSTSSTTMAASCSRSASPWGPS
jgi:hypothetical protein